MAREWPMDHQMDHHQTLQAHLAAQGADADCAAVIAALAGAARELARQIAVAPLSGVDEGAATVNADGDVQKALDIVADNLMRDALRRAPVAGILSEEGDRPETVNAAAPLCVAIDPLDGSSNLQNNISVGTIFSIRPRGRDVLSSFFEPGTAQLAAGFFVYGPQTCLVLAIDHRVDLYVLHPTLHEFMLAKSGIRIPQDTPEFAINASNRRHWSGTVRNYVDECLSGAAGPRGRDFNMRWIASLVAEAYRILMRGGVFLYPADSRPGYREGRLRLVYEAHPMALIMEWAGGSASSGRARILELSARSPHQRAPLIMGDVRLVRDVDQLHEGIEPLFETSDAPLFARRGLFR
ncbi:class 1 fructose-bisphosphatase [Bradyrhizobium sp. HKCCYLRH2060]|uniref:class 1 fructose-bisphosphatase n=1 Tax=Bradyrhizobium TaxID=374 RepID=UPI0028F1272E|nr:MULTISPECIES: class 1 fructose-bisphosphatase [unclassified Bradyrhizobium]